nr:pumilio homolog 24 [Tanacetum cinerariifolium]
MKKKINEIVGSHVSCHVLQFCSQDERNTVYLELKPYFLTIACNTYAVHLITKIIEGTSGGIHIFPPWV